MYDSINGIAGDAGVKAISYGWNCSGYADGTQMFKEIVVSNKDVFNYELTDTLKVFGE